MYSKVIDLIVLLISKNIIKTTSSFIIAISSLVFYFIPELRIHSVIIGCILLIMSIIPKYIKKYFLGLLDEHKQIQDDKHSELMKYRREISMKIDELLFEFGKKVMADRIIWSEYSNSTLGFTGIPFMYFSIHNEYCKPGIIPINTQFQKQNIGLFKFIDKLYTSNISVIDDIKNIKNSDVVTYTLFKKNNIKKGYFISADLNGTKLGFLGVTYNSNTDIDENVLIVEMSNVVNKIINLLDISKTK